MSNFIHLAVLSYPEPLDISKSSLTYVLLPGLPLAREARSTASVPEGEVLVLE